MSFLNENIDQVIYPSPEFIYYHYDALMIIHSVIEIWGLYNLPVNYIGASNDDIAYHFTKGNLSNKEISSIAYSMNNIIFDKYYQVYSYINNDGLDVVIRRIANKANG